MRIAGSLVLAPAATIVGLLGVLMLGLAGVHWDGGLVVAQLSDSDDTERTLGIAMGVGGLLGWVGLSCAAAYAGLGGQRPSAASRIAVWTILGLGVATIASATTFVLFFNSGTDGWSGVETSGAVTELFVAMRRAATYG